ncbi:hypothetical protein OG233_10755 [Streptomyces sp. NBC_01218]|nr:hypothetical protein OG233_10755 [Streptomyces sp. NBC_01218]
MVVGEEPGRDQYGEGGDGETGRTQQAQLPAEALPQLTGTERRVPRPGGP